MPQICIQKLPDALNAPTDIPGVRHTVNLPPIPDTVATWRDLLTWIVTDPHASAQLNTALTALLGPGQIPEDGP